MNQYISGHVFPPSRVWFTLWYFFITEDFFFCPISTAVSNLVRVMFALTRLIAGNSNNHKIITKKRLITGFIS